MRKMADSTNAAELPEGCELYAGYVDGQYTNLAAVRERFPTAVIVAITVDPTSDNGVVGDGPPDNGTWTKWVAWVARRRAAGVDPTMYTDSNQVAAGQAAFKAHGIAEPNWWVAAWTGTPPSQFVAGVVAEQYASPSTGSGGDYDLSTVADYWPGVDPPTGGDHYAGYPGLPDDPDILPVGEVIRLPNGVVVHVVSEGVVNYVNPHDNPGLYATAKPWNGPEPAAPAAPAPAPVEPPAPTPTTYSLAGGLPALATGAKGDSVKVLQDVLNALDDAGLAVDGMYGPNTAAAVERFQSRSHLTVDGVAGAETWAAIAASL